MTAISGPRSLAAEEVEGLPLEQELSRKMVQRRKRMGSGLVMARVWRITGSRPSRNGAKKGEGSFSRKSSICLNIWLSEGSEPMNRELNAVVRLHKRVN